MGRNKSAMGRNTSAMGRNKSGMGGNMVAEDVPARLAQAVARLSHRMKHEDMLSLICELCAIAPLERLEISKWVRRDERYVRRFLNELLNMNRLQMTIPDMPRHPLQAYVAVTTPLPDAEEGEHP